MKRVYRTIFTILLLLMPPFAGQQVSLVVAQQTSLTAIQQEYLDTCVPLARQVMRETGVPVCISLAQAIVESAWGTSTIARKAKNHFCIKCNNAWKGKCFEHPDDKIDDKFRVYPSIYASFKDYGEFLRYNKRYAFLFDLDPNDYKAWAHGLKQAGYATNPKYATILISTIERYNLLQYNQIVTLTGEEKTVETPTTVARLEEPVRIKEVRLKGESFVYNVARTVYSHNRTEFVIAYKGDTYESIAKRFNLLSGEIYAFNDVKKGAQPLEGSRVYLQAKRAQAAKGLKKVIVSQEMTLWDISQEYAVRLSALCRLNGLKADAVLSVGDEILLRKDSK